MASFAQEFGSAVIYLAPRLYGNILFNGFATQIKEEDQKDKTPVTLAHFLPFWKLEDPGSSEKNGHIIDKCTGDYYFDETSSTIRKKCAALFFATFVFQIPGLLFNMINRVAKLISLSHFWHATPTEVFFSARLAEARGDVLRVVASPLLLLGMLFSSSLGSTLAPLTGRKLYATCERAAYAGGYEPYENFGTARPDGEGKTGAIASFFLAPCFQPKPRGHLFGGTPGDPNAW